MRTLPVALELYSVREEAARDFEGAMREIKAMGYDAVELSGLYDLTSGEVKSILDNAGLRAIAAHVPFKDLIKDAEKEISEYSEIGCRYIVVPYLSEDMRPGTSLFTYVLKEIERIAEVCTKKGKILLYHNHDFEFVRMEDGSYALDYIFDMIPADLLKTELDTCWIKVAGENPVAYIEKYAGRCPVIHLKDYYAEGAFFGRPYKPADAEDGEKAGTFEFRPIGYGVQNIPPILEAAVKSGADWVVVEQDESKGCPALEAAKISREYLKSLGW